MTRLGALPFWRRTFFCAGMPCSRLCSQPGLLAVVGVGAPAPPTPARKGQAAGFAGGKAPSTPGQNLFEGALPAAAIVEAQRRARSMAAGKPGNDGTHASPAAPAETSRPPLSRSSRPLIGQGRAGRQAKLPGLCRESTAAQTIASTALARIPRRGHNKPAARLGQSNGRVAREASRRSWVDPKGQQTKLTC